MSKDADEETPDTKHTNDNSTKLIKKEKHSSLTKKISFVQKDLYATTEIETKRWIEPIDEESARDNSINALIIPEA